MKEDRRGAEALRLAGIGAKTNNKKERTGNGVIPGLWQRFFTEELCALWQPLAVESPRCIYYDYDSDENGDYRIFIGVPAAAGTKAAGELEILDIPAGNYAALMSENGVMKDECLSLWNYVWTDWKKKNPDLRIYRFDQEIYYGNDQGIGSVELLLSIPSR